LRRVVVIWTGGANNLAWGILNAPLSPEGWPAGTRFGRFTRLREAATMTNNSRKTLVIGMCNPHREGDPLSPFWTAGKALFVLSGMPLEEYEATFERVNVLEERHWSSRRARAAARSLRSLLDGRDAIVLGRATWKALGLPPIDWFETMGLGGSRFTLIPHPSGRNRMYNDAANKRRARGLLRRSARIRTPW
jgi:hypothetical protein